MACTEMSSQPPRSATALRSRREPLPWPQDRPFRILSIDGGGIRGIFPATVLAEFEKEYLGGRCAAESFDLIAGTSTGGIIALGLSAGMRSSEIADMYLKRGNVIFPPPAKGALGRIASTWSCVRRLLKFRYKRTAITKLLSETFGDRTLASAETRLCIPTFEGAYGEVYIYKTPHHLDFYLDGPKPMTTVALATSAAPTYFQPLADRGHLLVDGGIWANNPLMIAVVDALTCYSVPRSNIQVLSLGCGDEVYEFGKAKMRDGGLVAWRDLLLTVMRLQSQNALGQARLLLGAGNVVRIEPPELNPGIALDDWSRACEVLPPLAQEAAEKSIANVAHFFSVPVTNWRNTANRETG